MTEPASPRVSVVMATLNRAGALPGAIESVLSQAGVSFELIVVDDGSTDPTPEVLDRYRDDPRVKVLRNDRNLGLPAALNRGIGLARGRYIARIDDDDHWTETAKLQRQAACLDQQPEIGVLGTAFVDETGREVFNPRSDSGIRAQMLFRCPFCHPSVLVRADAIRQAGGYDESLRYAEDWELWMRIGRDWQFANLAEVTLRKCQGDNTLSARYHGRQATLARRFIATYGKDYPRSWLAGAYHAATALVFRVAPPGSALNRRLSGLFRQTFRLDGR